MFHDVTDVFSVAPPVGKIKRITLEKRVQKGAIQVVKVVIDAKNHRDIYMLTNELERVDTMHITDVVAYVNRLVMWLECNDCTVEERKKGLALLLRLSGRVRFLKLKIESVASQAMCSD